MIWEIIKRRDLYRSVLVSVRAPIIVLGQEEVRDNVGVVHWHMPASLEPVKYAISVRSDDSIKNMISRAGNFVVNFVGYEYRNHVLACENEDGLFVDIFEFLGFTKKNSIIIESPRIKEAKVFLECEVEQEFDSGDHTIFIGKVVGP
ncbi:hypothetical protein AYK26_00235 [Euryarchaeota archaeon SM23-78]|nr:MAG: hypothetical protein AYK26_00235 [Euryarchaeota archaeon SM23-78]MBW3001390.1 flavin reductase family protein [Candidatus Woesearchaeota archaeon]